MQRYKSWLYSFLSATLLLISSGIHSQQTISVIKALPVGSVITTTGTISTGDEYGVIRYMQDNAAGIALYSKSLATTSPGDSITVTGQLSMYKGELQLSPVFSYQLISSGHQINYVPVENFKTISSSFFTGRLVRMQCTKFLTCESVFADGSYQAYDQFGNTNRIIFSESSPMIGQPVPGTTLILSGIWTSVNGQYQLLLRAMADGSENDCQLIPAALVTFNNNLVQLNWHNMPVASTFFEWGQDNFSNHLGVGLLGPDWTFPPPALEPGKIYQGRIRQILHTVDTISSPIVLFAAPSSGPAIQVFFNHDVDVSYSDGSVPTATGPDAIESALIDKIDQVHHTLDIAMYNTTRSTLVQAVQRAVQRGVEVRYIADDETSNTALNGITTFPILFRSDAGIMHDKFVIADADDAALAWIWTGSTNWTGNQLSSDPNHAYIIQDMALAQNYTREFDEMWGQQPSHSDSRIGEYKTDNTAHEFNYNDHRLESYFSPSDEVNCRILEALKSATYHVEVSLLLLTSFDLIDELIRLHQNGVGVRVILEDEESSAYAVSQLITAGIPLAFHLSSSIFHHKVAIIDEGFPESDPMVITGSHNWTYSADHINDENTLIVHDQSFANVFRQEFEARWHELYTSLNEQGGSNTNLLLYPNPAGDFIEINNAPSQPCNAQLCDLNGHVITERSIPPGELKYFSLPVQLNDGYYVMKLIWPHEMRVSQIVVCRK